VPNPVVLPARLGRGGAAQPPHPSSQGPCRSGRPRAQVYHPELTPGRRRRPAQVMVGRMPPTPALTTCAQPCHSLGCPAPIPRSRPTGDPAQPAVPGRPGDRTRPGCPSASTTTTRSSPTSPLAQHRRRRRRGPCSGSGSCPSRSRVRQGGQTHGLTAWPPDAPTHRRAPRSHRCGHNGRGTRTPTPDTRDTRTPRDTGHRTRGHRTSGHWTPDTGRVDADRGCGQGDQAMTGVPTAGPYDKPTACRTPNRVPVGGSACGARQP
jgi:hypothetical protein